MLKNKSFLVTLSLSACLAINSMAEDKVKLSSVNITDTALEDHIKTITSEKLENLQASDVKDILSSMPSVIVDGNSRYSQKVYVRGLEDKFSNITIDGARMGGQLFHHSGDQTIDAELLKIGSIELGPNSALSGPGVINGSFIYETKDPSDFLEDGETFGGKIGFDYQSGFDRKGANIALFSKINDKLELVGIYNTSKDETLEIPGKEDIKSKESKLESGLIKFVLKPNDDNTIKLSYNTYKDGGNRQLSGEKPGDAAEDNPYNDIQRDTYTLNYNYNPNNDYINFDARVYSNSQKLNRASYSSSSYINRPDLEYEYETLGLDLRNSSIINDNNILTFGVDYSDESQSKTADGLTVKSDGSTSDETFYGDAGIKVYGLYLEDELTFNNFSFNLGARYDVHKLGGIYSGNYKQFSPKLKMAYQANDELKLRAGYGKIFKGPALPETLMINDTMVQSNNTEPQTGNNYEVGFDYDLSDALSADKSSFGFTAYTYNVDNYAHPTKNTKLTPQSDVEVTGFETVFNYKQGNLGLNLSHTYTTGDDESLSTGLKAEPKTANIHTFKVGLDYDVSTNLYLNYRAEFVPGNDYTRVQTFRNGDPAKLQKIERSGYAVHNIAATYKLESLKGAKISFGIDNIFDKKYARHTSFGTYFGNDDYTPFEVGRNFKFKLSYRF